ncbi:MAG TPA: hypothetical protein VEL03_07155 [Streptosporangiaceae bacterium]|nr:hypothetical protein [Streptosporangiaceae bacterium]
MRAHDGHGIAVAAPGRHVVADLSGSQLEAAISGGLSLVRVSHDDRSAEVTAMSQRVRTTQYPGSADSVGLLSQDGDGAVHITAEHAVRATRLGVTKADRGRRA